MASAGGGQQRQGRVGQRVKLFHRLEPAQLRPSECWDTEVQAWDPTSASPLPGAHEPVSYVTSIV